MTIFNVSLGRVAPHFKEFLVLEYSVTYATFKGLHSQE